MKFPVQSAALKSFYFCLFLTLIGVVSPANAQNFSGELTSANEFKRPLLPSDIHDGESPYLYTSVAIANGSNWTVNGLDAGAITSSSLDFKYYQHFIVPSVSGDYSLTVLQENTEVADTIFFLYQDSFSPGAPTTNILAGNDDTVSGTNLRSRLVDVPLEAGKVYILVVTTYEETDLGAVYFNVSGPAPVTESASAPLTAPRNVSVEVGNQSAEVSFSAPSSDGGSAILDYTVTVQPGDIEVTGAGSPIEITSLNNGQSYTFTVTARTAEGTSPASPVAGPAIPGNSQTITFDNPGTQNFGTTLTLDAVASSYLAITYSSLTSHVCEVDGNTVSYIQAGNCTIQAEQPGDNNYFAATPVSHTFTVSVVYPGAPSAVTAVAGDGEATISFSPPASNGGAAITGYTVLSNPGGETVNGAGSPITVTGLTNGVAYTFTVNATNAAGSGAASVASNSVTPGETQTITFENPGDQSYRAPATLEAEASSALTVSFSSDTPAVCTVTSEGALTFIATGSCTIVANQPGNGLYGAAAPVSQTFEVIRYNDAPAELGLTTSPAYTDGGEPVVLDAGILLFDQDLSELNAGEGNYAGATLNITRFGGSNAEDSFDFDVDGASFTVAGGELLAGGQAFATVSTANGMLTITFTSSDTTATSALVNEVARRITYSNTNQDPESSVNLSWGFNDGNAGAQGTDISGTPLSATVTGSTAVSISAINDAPTVTAVALDPVFTENDDPVALFSNASVSTIESGQRIIAISFNIAGVMGDNEYFVFPGIELPVAVNTANLDGLTIEVTAGEDEGSFDVSFTGLTNEAADIEEVITAAGYVVSGENPAEGQRVITVTSLQDDGGTDNGGNDTGLVDLVSTVNVVAVNDVPVINMPGDITVVDGQSVAITDLSVDDADHESLSLLLSVPTGTLTLGDNTAADVTAEGTINELNTLLQTLTFNAPEGVAASTTLTVTADDGVGSVDGYSNLTVVLRPDVSGLADLAGSTINLPENADSVVLDDAGTATLVDDNYDDYDGGSLLVSIISGGVPTQDLLRFRSEGAVSLEGDTAFSPVYVYDGTNTIQIGMLGQDLAAGSNLEVMFNSHATPELISIMLRELTYENIAANRTAGTRQLQIAINNGQHPDAVSSITLGVKVIVEPPPSSGVIDSEVSNPTLSGQITVTEKGVLNGGTINGTITNNGVIIGTVNMGSGSIINGGTVSGNIIGNEQQPAVINNATITGGATLSNVIVGADTVLQPGVQLGSNVKFESEESIPPGLALTGALRTLDWQTGDERSVVVLDGDVMQPSGGEDPMTIIRAIQLLGDYEPAGNELDQDSVTGEIIVLTSDFRAAVLPVQVFQADPDDVEGTYINEDGDIVFVAVNRRVVLAYPVLADKTSFLNMLSASGLELTYDSRANMQVKPQSTAAQLGERQVAAVTSEGGEFYYSARPDAIAIPAHRQQTPGLVEFEIAGLGTPSGLSIVHESADGEMLEQDLIPASPDWFALKEGLLAIDVVSDVSIDEQGILTVVVDGQPLRARLEYVVFSGREAARESAEIRGVGDKTGNGTVDYEVVYPNGDVQYLYVF